MITLSTLANTHRAKDKIQRVGRGPGSKRGKTCCRGAKGDKARSGYKRRYGYEGGQLPLYRKLPCRGFSNARFRSRPVSINLSTIDKLFHDGEVVNVETLFDKGYASRRQVVGGLKILAHGDLSKKVTIEADEISQGAREKLEKKNISFSLRSV